MNSNKRIPRLLGVAFFTVAVTSVLASLLSVMSLLSGSIADGLVNVANNLLQYRVSILLELITSLGIVVLAVLLFVVLKRQNKIIALVALGWWLVESALLAASKVGAFALIPLSLDYAAAGAGDATYLETLGALFFGVDRWGYEIHMVFFALGGLLWYSLFYRSRHIPRLLSVWGLVGVSLVLIVIVSAWFGVQISALLFLPNVVLELVIGLWLMIKGIEPDKLAG